MSSAPPTPTKRKTPAKQDAQNKLAGLTETELKALCYGMACATEPIKVDYEKLAAMMGITRKSATNQWGVVRKKLETMYPADTGADPNDPTTPAKKARTSKANGTPKTPRAKKSTPGKAAQETPAPDPHAEIETTPAIKDEEEEALLRELLKDESPNEDC